MVVPGARDDTVADGCVVVRASWLTTTANGLANVAQTAKSKPNDHNSNQYLLPVIGNFKFDRL